MTRNMVVLSSNIRKARGNDIVLLAPSGGHNPKGVAVLSGRSVGIYGDTPLLH